MDGHLNKFIFFGFWSTMNPIKYCQLKHLSDKFFKIKMLYLTKLWLTNPAFRAFAVSTGVGLGILYTG